MRYKSLIISKQFKQSKLNFIDLNNKFCLICQGITYIKSNTQPCAQNKEFLELINNFTTLIKPMIYHLIG